MSITSPNMLWLLLILPLTVLGYVLLIRRRNKAAVRYASLDLIKGAIGKTQSIRRHVPPAFFLVAMGLALFAVTRPAAVITLPSQRETIILVMDVSGSMRASDVEPQRITAAQAAALSFVKDQPEDARIGVVAFSSSAMTIQQPTLNREDVSSAIQRLQPQRYTAVGSGILVALEDIFQNLDLEGEMPQGERGRALGDTPAPAPQDFKPVAAGSFTSAVVILMTDGQSNMGADPIKAAKAAADRGVRVFTIGFGSEKGGIVEFEGRQTHVALDEETLKRVADITHAAYYRAGSQKELSDVYKTLTTTLVMEKRKTELTSLFAGAAALVVVLAGVLSLLWVNRSV